MRIDALALRLRRRSWAESADLGIRLCREAAWPLLECYGALAVPLLLGALALHGVASWLPTLVIWWAKPWLDRTILFVLSRAAFGQSTRVFDLWRAQWDVCWKRAWFSWTIRRLSPWRSLTEPVYALEGLSLGDSRARVRHMRQRSAGAGFMVMHVCAMAEFSLVASILSLFFWMAPTGLQPDVGALLEGQVPHFSLALPTSYALAVLVIEPFYVAAGFSLYLHRRAELEAWDLEQEFRRAFAA